MEDKVSENTEVEDSAIDDRTFFDKTTKEFRETATQSSEIFTGNMADSKVYHIHRFNGQNYQLWKRQMGIYMVENKLKNYILGTVPRPSTNTEAWDEKHAEAQAFIMRGLELDQLKHLISCTTAAEMWSRLKTVHSERSEQSGQVLLEKFINSSMEEEESIADYIARVTCLAQRLKDMNLEQKQPVVITKILSSLPANFDHVRTAWYAVPSAEQSIERLTDHLINEESLIKLRQRGGNEDSSEAVYTAKSGKAKTRHNRSGACKNESTAKKPGKFNYCSKPGHWVRECFKRQRDQQNKLNQQNSKNLHSLMIERETNKRREVGTSTKKEPHLFTLQNSKTTRKAKDVWYADSGATDHMSFQRELFKNFTPFSKDTCSVKVGDGRKLAAEGTGDIEVQVKGSLIPSPVHVVKNVLFVPDLDRNFISVSRCTEKGMRVTFEEGGERVTFAKGDEIIADGVRSNRLNKRNLEPIKSSEVNVASGSLMLWHERLGNVNFKTLREMKDRLSFTTSGNLFFSVSVITNLYAHM